MQPTRIKNSIREEFNEEGWMQAVNVREDDSDEPSDSPMKKKLKEAVDEILQQLLLEDPASVYDQAGNYIIGCSDSEPAVAFFMLIDKQLGKTKWFWNDKRDGGPAWHSGVRVINTPDFPNATNLETYNVRGRLWPRLKICAFYQKEQFLEQYFEKIEEFFQMIDEDIKTYKFDFDDSSRTVGFKPWPGAKGSKARKMELPPEIAKKIADLQAQLHFATADKKKEIDAEIEDLYKKAGVESARGAEKAAYRKATAGKRSPFEKGGGGSYAGYAGRLPALEEDNVRIYNKTLCPDLWDENKKLDPNVRKALLTIAFDFYSDTELTTKVQDVYLLGSAANYNWTPASDMDVHIIVDGTQLQMQPEIAEQFFRSLVGKWNLQHDIEVKGHKVELYLQDVREKNAATAIYSLVRDQWVKEPTPENVSVDKEAIQKKYTGWVQKINDAIQRKDEKALKKMLDTLREYRQAGLDKQGEFSTENLVFKILRSRGFLDKIKDFYNSIYDKKMAVKDGFDPTSVGPNPEASEGQIDANGAYYQEQNRKMRQLEAVLTGPIRRSKLKQVQNKMPDDYTDLKLDRYTLENLQSAKKKVVTAIQYYMAQPEASDKETLEILRNALEQINTEIDTRLDYINKPVTEGVGAGNPEEDRLKITHGDYTERWRIRSKDAPKTPKLPEGIQELVNEILDEHLPLLFESPNQATLKKNKRPLTDEERAEVMKAGAVWHMGSNGKPSPAVWKAVVKGKTWYACNTHRAIQIKPTLKGAIKAFEFIKTTS
jgi:hypothetical protein